MTSRVLSIPNENIGRLIGTHGRNIYFVNQMIKPGKIVIEDGTVTIHGDLTNTNWRQRASRVIRSAHRGGIIKWFDGREASRLTKHTREQWLCMIRDIETNTNTVVHQQHVRFKDIEYEVWVVLELSKKSKLDTAILQIGHVIHKRYKMRDILRKDGTATPFTI